MDNSIVQGFGVLLRKRLVENLWKTFEVLSHSHDFNKRA